MKLLTSFSVAGTPQQQGSKSPQGWEANKNLKPWRLTVAQVASEEYIETPYDGPVKIVARFRYARLRAHVTSSGTLKPTAPHFKMTAPDLDKLQRALGDALTGVVISDDRVIAQWKSEKVFGIQDGLDVEVYSL